MKKLLILAATFSSIIFVTCGPAAEDREQMHARAKVFQDSIANVIKQSMAEAEAPGPMMMQTPTGTAPTATPPSSPAPTPHNPVPNTNVQGH